VGSAFTPRSGQALPDEEVRVGVICMGASRPPHFTEPAPRAFDLWDAKGIAVDVLRVTHPGSALQLVTDEGDDLWRIVGPDGVVVGRVVRVPLDRPVWSHEPFGIEILLGRMPNEAVAPPGKSSHLDARAPTVGHVRYRALPVTPPAEFDLAVLVPDGISADQVAEVLRASGGELLESIVLFDEYRGEGVVAGMRSVAWRLTFRDPVRTLRDKEVEGRRQKILKALEGELGVRPRSA
jgi:phenylalanyl-tRNA synthetase beta chain